MTPMLLKSGLALARLQRGLTIALAIVLLALLRLVRLFQMVIASLTR